jgi:hypothetical protein
MHRRAVNYEFGRIYIRIQTTQPVKNVSGAVGKVAAVLCVHIYPFTASMRGGPAIISPAGGFAAYRFIYLDYPRLINLPATGITQRTAMVEVPVNVVRPTHLIFNVISQSRMDAFRTVAYVVLAFKRMLCVPGMKPPLSAYAMRGVPVLAGPVMYTGKPVCK